MGTSASFEVGVIKWEDSPGLYHGCAVCGICLNSPKAKRTCYGVHSEPCIRYHQTMFHVGNSHKCEACRKSNECHEKRHKEIASLIQQVAQIDKQEFIQNDQLNDSRRKTCHENSQIGNSSERLEDHGNTAINDRTKFPMTPVNRFLSVKCQREEKKIVRFDKSIIRTMRRQSNTDMTGIVLASLVDRMDKAIHGTLEIEPSMTPRQAYSALEKTVSKYRELESQMEKLPSRRKSKRRGTDASEKNPSPKNSYHNKLELPFIKEIFTKLDIRVASKNPSKERKTLLLKVADAIVADVELIANEARETMRRSAGYWRFVNKRTYNAMVENNQSVNWATGERLSDGSNDTGSINA